MVSGFFSNEKCESKEGLIFFEPVFQNTEITPVLMGCFIDIPSNTFQNGTANPNTEVENIKFSKFVFTLRLLLSVRQIFLSKCQIVKR